MEPETPYQKVERFHRTFDPRIPDRPTAFTKKHADDRAGFKIEELVEFVAAASGGDAEKLHDSVQYLHQALDQAEKKMLTKKAWGEESLVEQVDALTDLLYFTYGSFSLLGVDPTKIFDIVHQANMGKLFPDGKPHYDPITNKVMKPDNWQRDYAPEDRIAKEIQKQISRADQLKSFAEKLSASD